MQFAAPGIEGPHVEAMRAGSQVGRQRAAPQVRGRRRFGGTIVTAQRIGLVVAAVLGEQAGIGRVICSSSHALRPV